MIISLFNEKNNNVNMNINLLKNDFNITEIINIKRKNRDILWKDLKVLKVSKKQKK
jgi:hypothetical protein